MEYNTVKDLKDEAFRLLTVVKRSTFERMISILQAVYMKKKSKDGRNNKLSIENMLLMSLEYLR